MNTLRLRNLIVEDRHLNVLKFFHQLGVNIRQGRVKRIKFLLEFGSDIKFPYEDGWRRDVVT